MSLLQTRIRPFLKTDIQRDYEGDPFLHRLVTNPSYGHSRPIADPAAKNTVITLPTGLSGPVVHVFDRSANSHRETSSPRPTTHETHKVASRKQLEN